MLKNYINTPEPEWNMKQIQKLLALWVQCERPKYEESFMEIKLSINGYHNIVLIPNIFANRVKYAGFNLYNNPIDDIRLYSVSGPGAKSLTKKTIETYQYMVDEEKEKFKNLFLKEYLPALKPKFSFNKLFNWDFWKWFIAHRQWSNNLKTS